MELELMFAHVHIIVVTCALVFCLICTPSSLGPAALGIRVYISGRTLVPMLQLLNVTFCVGGSKGNSVLQFYYCTVAVQHLDVALPECDIWMLHCQLIIAFQKLIFFYDTPILYIPFPITFDCGFEF